MSLWRVRIAMSDDPASRALFTEALARQRISAQPPSHESPSPGDVIIELPRDDRLGALLSDLHLISPQVFVSSLDASLPVALTAPIKEKDRQGESIAGFPFAGRPRPVKAPASLPRIHARQLSQSSKRTQISRRTGRAVRLIYERKARRPSGPVLHAGDDRDR